MFIYKIHKKYIYKNCHSLNWHPEILSLHDIQKYLSNNCIQRKLDEFCHLMDYQSIFIVDSH